MSTHQRQQPHRPWTFAQVRSTGLRYVEDVDLRNRILLRLELVLAGVAVAVWAFLSLGLIRWS